jgi:type VI secretion system protein ImpH
MEDIPYLNTISFINSHIKSYEFFQAVRIIENTLEDNPPIGTQFHLKFDLVKFNQNPGLKYFTSDINRCRINKKKEKIEVITNFVGLLGTNGVMPYFLTEHILEQLRNKNLALLDFLNIFHHRMISFLYRAWAINNQIVSYEKGKYDYFSSYLCSLTGHNYKLHNTNSSLHYDFKLYFAGHFIQAAASEEVIESIIREYFNIPASVEPFVAQWLELPEDSLVELGLSENTGTIGRNTFMGDKIWNCTSKFRVILGPMSAERYNSLLPGTKSFTQLREIIKLISPVELQYDLQFIIEADEVPFIDGSFPSQLGYNSWLLTEKPKDNQKNFYIKNL